MSRQFIPDEDLAFLGKAHAHEPFPVGRTEEDRQRNAVLLGGYDYAKYPAAITGYSGQDLQRIASVGWFPAVRTRVGGRGNYKAGFTQMPDGRLVIAVCRDMKKPEPATGRFRIFVYESTDTGLTWRETGRTPLFGKEPSLAALPGGGLVLTAQQLRSQSGGPAEERHLLARSEDGGRTWDVSHFVGPDYPRNLTVEPDGSVTMVTALKPDWYSEGGGSPNLLVRTSSDGGRTWDSCEGEVDWNWPGFGEVGSVRLEDGRLLAVLRRQIPGTSGEGFEDSVLTESHDEGKTWSRPWRLTRTAQVHAHVIELRDGRLLCTFSNYHVPFGVSAMVSADGGATWARDNPIRLSLSNDVYVGWAVTLQLDDGSLITSYAVTSHSGETEDRSSCEVVRWNLPE